MLVAATRTSFFTMRELRDLEPLVPHVTRMTRSPYLDRLQSVIYHDIYRKEVLRSVPPNCSATAAAKRFAFPRIIGSRVPRCTCAAIRLQEM